MDARHQPVLYVRAGCHLCEEAATLLRRLGCVMTLVDVDTSPELTALYGERVPVLVAGDRPVAWGIIHEADVRDALR